MYFVTYFVRSPAAAPPWHSPLSAQFYCYYRPPEGRRNSIRIWSAVCAQGQSEFNQFQVPGLGCGGWRILSRARSLALSKCKATVVPHQSVRVPETGRLYSTDTHHTGFLLQGLGSFNLDLVGLSLSVGKWGPTLLHPVHDAPCGSWFN
jgi:hypothetical protein